MKKINRALISAYHKEKLSPLIRYLASHQVEFVATGGTQTYIKQLGYPVTSIEKLTGYPSIFGGRVKSLHPMIHGGILFRRSNPDDQQQSSTYNILPFDLVIVDLYPFEETVLSHKKEEEVIEKIDVGGVALIRAAAKNYTDVCVISSSHQYAEALSILEKNNGKTTLSDRLKFSVLAFKTTAHYDTAIGNYLNRSNQTSSFHINLNQGHPLRYGENPHQKGTFYGPLEKFIEKLNGKDLSYNNLVDLDAAIDLISEFDHTGFAIIKHTNACGVALGNSVAEAFTKAYQVDPVSAFGGVFISNRPIDPTAAKAINSLFYEVLIAPDYSPEALLILCEKKNRIILKQKSMSSSYKQFKSLLNGVIEQDKDRSLTMETRVVTEKAPSPEQMEALLFSNMICKHAKSNAIVLATKEQLLASGSGQTSRIDALNQAVEKALRFKLPLHNAVMASDAFFPFADCVSIAHTHGIQAVIQPGGSIKDQESIDFCNHHNMAMIFTGMRHFRH